MTYSAEQGCDESWRDRWSVERKISQNLRASRLTGHLFFSGTVMLGAALGYAVHSDGEKADAVPDIMTGGAAMIATAALGSYVFDRQRRDTIDQYAASRGYLADPEFMTVYKRTWDGYDVPVQLRDETVTVSSRRKAVDAFYASVFGGIGATNAVLAADSGQSVSFRLFTAGAGMGLLAYGGWTHMQNQEGELERYQQQLDNIDSAQQKFEQ